MAERNSTKEQVRGWRNRDSIGPMSEDAANKAIGKTEEVRAWRNRGSLGPRSDSEVNKAIGKTDEVRAYASFRNIGKAPRRISDFQGISELRLISSYDEEEGEEDEKIAMYRDDDDQTSSQNADAVDPIIRDLFSVYFVTNENDEDSMNNTNHGIRELGIRGVLSSFITFAKSMNATMPWLPSKINNSFPLPRFFLFLEWNLRSIGQVFFCNNPMSGLLILIGLFIQSTRVAVHGVIALMAGNLAAIVLGFDTGLIASGLFGYNAVLVGLAIATFHSPEKNDGYEFPIVAFSIIISILSVAFFAGVGKILAPYATPPLTIPFNLATHLFLLATSSMSNVSMGAVITPSLPEYMVGDDGQDLIDTNAFFSGVLRGIGQVFLADDIVASALCLAGLFVCSRYIAIAAFTGSLLGCAFAVLLGSSNDMLENGLYGYSSSLTLAGMMLFYVPSISCIVMGIIAVLLTVIAQHALSGLMLPLGLPVMTSPFCLVTLLFLLFQGTTTAVIAVPLPSITIPEDHFRRVNLLRRGFRFLLDAIRSDKYSKSIQMSRNAKRTMRLMSEAIEHVDVKEIEVTDKTDKITRGAVTCFETIDVISSGSISKEIFLAFLRSIHGDEETGCRNAGEAFSLMDFHGEESMNLAEFVSFVKVSYQLDIIKKKIANFFYFVHDSKDDRYFDFNDLNSALKFLELPALGDAEYHVLTRASGLGRNQSFNTTRILDFVTMSVLKDVVADAARPDQRFSSK
jgi:urea transporter